MIKSREELLSRLESGEDVEKLVEERLSYLNSEEYRDTLFPTVYGEDDEDILLKNGFISSEEIFGTISNPKKFKEIFGEITSYVIDDEQIYIDILNEILRFGIEDIEKLIMSYTIFYFEGFSKDKKSAEFIDILDYLEHTEKVDFLIRGKIAKLINEYLYLKNYKKGLSVKEYIDLRKKYLNAMQKEEENSSKEENDALLFFYESGLLDKRTWNQVSNAPINIKDIKDLDIGMCVEKSMLTQNILSFLGYNAYLVNGRSQNNGHVWNVIEQDGTYSILDTNQNLYGIEFGRFDNPRQLLTFGELQFIKANGTNLKYQSSYNKDDLGKIAADGKMYRYDASDFLERIDMYRQLHNLPSSR